MSMPPPGHPHLSERMPGTVWRAMRPLLVLLIVIGVCFTLFSVGVAIATADKCGGARFNTSKEWNYFPPRWDCTQHLPGQG
jgi:hypothetical protein